MNGSSLSDESEELLLLQGMCAFAEVDVHGLGRCLPGWIWDFPKSRVPYLGVFIIRILLFRVLY